MYDLMFFLEDKPFIAGVIVVVILIAMSGMKSDKTKYQNRRDLFDNNVSGRQYFQNKNKREYEDSKFSGIASLIVVGLIVYGFILFISSF